MPASYSTRIFSCIISLMADRNFPVFHSIFIQTDTDRDVLSSLFVFFPGASERKRILSVSFQKSIGRLLFHNYCLYNTPVSVLCSFRITNTPLGGLYSFSIILECLCG